MDVQFNRTPSELDTAPVTLKDILRKISRARWWIFVSVIIILIGSIYVTYSTPPEYQATVSVMIEKTSKAKTIFNFSENDFTISDEIAVILSRSVAEDVVKALWESNKRNRLYIFAKKKIPF